MTEKQSFMRVDEVAQELGVSKSYAYKLVKAMNKELAEQGTFFGGGGSGSHE